VSKQRENDLKEDMAEWIMSFAMRPLEAVLAWYPWGEDDLKDSDGPDLWQKRVLARLQRRLSENKHVIRIAVRSGHGVGKTALIAWLIHWFVSTRPNPQVVVTTNTKNQLETKTWRELAKWKPLTINGVYIFVGYRLGAHYTLRIRDRSGQLNGAVVDWVSAELP